MTLPKVTALPLLVILKEAHITFLKCAKEFRYQSRGRFVPPSKFDKVRFQTAAVTLKKGSRSNDWHGGKGLGKCVLCAQ